METHKPFSYTNSRKSICDLTLVELVPRENINILLLLRCEVIAFSYTTYTKTYSSGFIAALILIVTVNRSEVKPFRVVKSRDLGKILLFCNYLGKKKL